MRKTYFEKKNLSEKHVIKLPNQAPMMSQEPMGMEPEPMGDMGSEMPPMGDEGMGEDPMGDMGNEEGADDPKKNIQRLAGELSQALRTYNDEQQSPDTDLNKYVVGMIATQAGKNMTSDEKNEIIKKIQKGESVENENGGEGDEMAMEECKQNTVMDDEKKERVYKDARVLKNNPFSSKR
jgi:hypothetical protein